MSISRRDLKGLLVVLVAGLLSVPLADGAYRLAGARPSDDLTGLYRSFGDGGFAHRPEVTTSADWYSGLFEVRTDALGLRCGKDPSTRTRPGMEVDHLVLGDSQGYGQCLDFEASVVGGLAARAAAAGAHVANASVGGHFLENQLELARWLADAQGVPVDHVVVLLTPYLIATAGEYNRARVSPEGQLYEGDPTLTARVAVWAKTNTAIYGRVRNAVNNLRGVEPDHGRLLGFFDRAKADAAHRARLAGALERIRAWADSLGADCTVVYTPLAVELDFAPVAQVAGDRDVDPAVPFEQTRRACEALGLPLIDLRPVLAERKSAGKALTCRGDPHYDAETSQACARWIWERLPSTPRP